MAAFFVFRQGHFQLQQFHPRAQLRQLLPRHHHRLRIVFQKIAEQPRAGQIIEAAAEHAQILTPLAVALQRPRAFAAGRQRHFFAIAVEIADLVLAAFGQKHQITGIEPLRRGIRQLQHARARHHNMHIRPPFFRRVVQPPTPAHQTLRVDGRRHLGVFQQFVQHIIH